jgi:hypothetical protein
MTIKSEAHRKKLQQLVAEGKMRQETYDEWENSTQAKNLPERLPTKAPTKLGKLKKARVLR